MDKIAIIIPVYNRKNTTLNCISQFQQISKKGFETDIIVIDDGSTDGTSEAIMQKYPDTILLQGDGNLWWSGGINKGFEYALKEKYEFVYTINDDVKMFPETLQFLYDTTKNNRNAVAASVLLGEDDVIYSAGIKFKGHFKRMKSQIKGKYKPSYAGKIWEADCIATKSALIPIEVIKKVGFFNSKRFPHNYADFDYFIRVKKAGFSLLINMSSKIYTEGSDTSFHHLILNKKLNEVLKTFFNLKYGNQFRSLYNLAITGEGKVLGQLSFFYRLLPYLVWLTLKIILPKRHLRKILIKTGRIKNEE